MSEDQIAMQYGRVKGAEWFPFLHKTDIMVLGQGGIGSWVSLFLARIGADLHIFDHDMYESHNMTGQLVMSSQVGVNKAVAIKQTLSHLSPDTNVATYGKYSSLSPTNNIVICGFDNMEARKIAFANWKNNVEKYPESASRKFFQDGRLLAEQLQIFNIPGNRPDLIEKYEKERLPEDSEVEEADCVFKQTTHCAAMIASHMVGFLTNWATNAFGDIPYRQVPFFYEYIVPVNMHYGC